MSPAERGRATDAREGVLRPGCTAPPLEGRGGSRRGPRGAGRCRMPASRWKFLQGWKEEAPDNALLSARD